MQKVFGVLLLGGGLAFLVSEYTPSSNEREEQLAAITRIVARATIIEPETVPAEHPGLRRPIASPAATYVSPPAPVPPAAGGDLPATSVPAAPVVVAATLPSVTVPNDTLLRQPPSVAGSQRAQRQLARAIQTELKRVGCYSGRLDGSWGDRSRNAMATFMARVNASLPTNEPDVFLLSLIKGQANEVCGPACGTGEVLSGGRCTDKSVVADATPADRDAPNPVPAAAESYPAPIATRVDPLPGRMSIGGPVQSQAAAQAPVTEWTAPASERLPWTTDAQMAPPSTAMAALEPGDTQAGPVFNAPPVPRKVTKVKRSGSASKPVKRRYSSSRSVQQLFMHPLGRM